MLMPRRDKYLKAIIEYRYSKLKLLVMEFDTEHPHKVIFGLQELNREHPYKETLAMNADIPMQDYPNGY